MICGYCGERNHNISSCPYDNELVNLLYSSEDVDFASLSYKVLRKIASNVLEKSTLPKQKLVDTFNNIKNKQKKTEECAICYETIGQTNRCTTPCGHTFCMTCILTLVRNGSSSSNSCPLCRNKLLDTPVVNTIPLDNFDNYIVQQSVLQEIPDTALEPIELFPEPDSVTVITDNDNSNINYFEGIEYSIHNTMYNDENENTINNDDISELDIINLLSNNMELIPNRRQTRNEEEYRARQEHINERIIVQRG